MNIVNREIDRFKAQFNALFEDERLKTICTKEDAWKFLCPVENHGVSIKQMYSYFSERSGFI